MKNILLTLILLITTASLAQKPKTPVKVTSTALATFENLKAEINKLGIVYPDIALAQAKWESTHFTSDIFKENNNLFGMKLPAQRKTTAIGKNRGHAKYETWQDSVEDYKIWQDTLGWSSLPKEAYIQKLSDKYCMPPDCPKGYYSKIVKKTMASG